MSRALGVFLGRGIAAAALTGRASGTPPFEGNWDSGNPAELVAKLREHFGDVSRIALAIGLEYLLVKPLVLPPVGSVQRRRMLQLEPDRYFPVLEHGRYVVGVTGDPALAFLLDAAPLEAWIAAFGRWAPVERVDAAPVAAARALAAHPRVAIYDEDDGVAVIDVDRGRPTRVTRRGATDGVTTCTPAEVGRGAALGIDDPLDDALMPDSLVHAVTRGRRRRVATSTAALILAIVLTVWAADVSRRNLLDRINVAIAADSGRAAPALAMLDSLSASAREQAAVRQVAHGRSDPVSVLAQLSSLLSRDVVLQKVESTGGEWRIEGTARSASAIVRLLDAGGRFENVRPLRASTRFVDEGRTVETFAVAFRVRR